jgi:hypothetical protein
VSGASVYPILALNVAQGWDTLYSILGCHHDDTVGGHEVLRFAQDDNLDPLVDNLGSVVDDLGSVVEN